MTMMHTLTIPTQQRDGMIDITSKVLQYVQSTGVNEGQILVYCPHTTAGITINENADPDVVRDVLRRLDEQYPWDHELDRHAEGNTAAHLKAITTGSSASVIIHRGKLVLGIWQGIYLCEFDGPRTRQVVIKVING
jgi:secondary thiamine-phosphate synthase enzyme